MKKFLFIMPDWLGTSYLGALSILSYVNDDEHIQVAQGSIIQIQEKTKVFKPDILGFYSCTVDFNMVVKLAKKIKDEGFKGLMVIGGHHVSPLPTSIDGTVFDAAIRGDAEKSIKALIDGFSLKDISNIYINGDTDEGTIAKLNESELPVLNYDKMVRRSEIIWTMTSRGCPYRCRFCSTEFEKGYRRLSIEKIVPQIKSALKYGSGLGMWDDTFIGEKRLRLIYETLKKEKLLDEIKFMHVQARFCNSISPVTWEYLRKLKVTNINTGFESGSTRVLKYLKAHSKASVDNLKQNVLTAQKYNINCNGSFMLGIPTETIEEMRQTLELMKWCQKVGMGRFWYHVATPYPGTEFWEIAKKRNKVNNNMNFGELNLYDYHNPRLLDADYNDYLDVMEINIEDVVRPESKEN